MSGYSVGRKQLQFHRLISHRFHEQSIVVVSVLLCHCSGTLSGPSQRSVVTRLLARSSWARPSLPCPLCSSECWGGSQVPSCFSCRPPDLSLSELNPLLWRAPNHFSKLYPYLIENQNSAVLESFHVRMWCAMPLAWYVPDSLAIRRGLISLWLYEENKLRYWEKIYLHYIFPPELPTLMTLLF
jgi:hypothetical protein